ncbi:NAD 5'-nucleotidase [Tepidimonas thermarum]|uniref:NAD 5'-nucleotidase n=1 Tax=Tepidimonas thermarum TaxID=335431 RepID=A0A554WY76_9BURK|nr:5'-nucleotidase C-terminal domain-containing protein [Tepidimonas thermarum]TSE28521.1 NAD 5'-nucleotidase [Tepidimonas thermarum]
MPASNAFAPQAHRLASLALACAVGLNLAACGGSDDPDFKPIELNIAHINDHHSNLEAIPNFQLKLDGVDTRVEIGGFARQTALFKEAASKPNLLKLHAGDAITGSLYYTFFKGEADAKMMNTICFDAVTLGNHEFDDGDASAAAFIDMLTKGGCPTPTAVISANIVPKVGTPLLPTADKPAFRPYTIKKVDGVDVAIVGVATDQKTKQSSRPLESTQFLEPVAATQKAIDEVRALGVRHVVLLSHLGYDKDKALAAQLTDVDVIIGGDSHTLLGDFKAQGVESAGAYPTVVKNKDGDTVCIGQAWEYAKAFGLMNVKFDDRGRVTACGGQASLVIGDNYLRLGSDGKTWAALADAERAALTARLAGQSAVKVVAPDAGATQVLDGYKGKVTEAKAQVIGSATQDLCLVRVPGDTKDNRAGGIASCEQANTLARGSDISQVVAEAFLYQAKRADFALQNAGGVRISVPAGPVTMNTAFTLLPFNNVIVEFELTGAQVVAALEDGISAVVDGGSTGPYPYAAGLRWDVDMSRPKGQRLSNVQVRNKATGAWSAIDPARTYVLATNDFVAAGGDGYATLATLYKAGKYVNTYLLYTQSFVDYVKAKGSISRPARSEYSNQTVITKDGVRLPND